MMVIGLILRFLCGVKVDLVYGVEVGGVRVFFCVV